MSTSEYFEGRIDIDPALNFAEIRKARKIALGLVPQTGWEKKHANEENVFDSYMPLTFELDCFDKATEEGTLQVTRSFALKPTSTSGGCYSHRMAPLLEALIKGLPGHNWSGEVSSIDEDRRNALKVVVTTGKDKSTVAQIKGKGVVKWDDGSTSDIDEISG